jgi:hypothetical protein
VVKINIAVVLLGVKGLLQFHHVEPIKTLEELLALEVLLHAAEMLEHHAVKT